MNKSAENRMLGVEKGKRRGLFFFQKASPKVQEALKDTTFELRKYDVDMGLFILTENFGVKAVKGILGWIEYATREKMDRDTIAQNIFHDLVHSDDKHFHPRTYNFSKYFRKAADAISGVQHAEA